MSARNELLAADGHHSFFMKVQTSDSECPDSSARSKVNVKKNLSTR